MEKSGKDRTSLKKTSLDSAPQHMYSGRVNARRHVISGTTDEKLNQWASDKRTKIAHSQLNNGGSSKSDQVKMEFVLGGVTIFQAAAEASGRSYQLQEYLYFTTTAACSGHLLKNMIVLTEGDHCPQQANTGVYTQKLIVLIETTW